ncbi:hypothetical protein [Nocardioides perillae]|uniref:Uncharacterized protein n=1 Tax=Nocardioides perillae TaxID=1119534 RepID=A0A7Y9RUK0_9ACTN|nr:hypothetical protein [Nocardioides perillae]NYG55158.1 hypothetical protein [Nocardioides perillae]
MQVSGSSADEVGQVAAGLAEDGVWVHPSLAGVVGGARERVLEDAVAASPTPVFVVVHPLPYDGAFGGRADELLTLVHDRTGVDGLYLATPDLGGEGARVEGLGWDSPVDAWQVTYAATEQALAEDGDAVDALVEAVDVVRDGRVAEAYQQASALAEERYAAEQAERGDETTSTGAAGGGSGDGDLGSDDGGGVDLVAGLLLVGVMTVVAVAVRRTRATRTAPAPPAGWRLPESALGRVRSAEDQRLTRQARADLLRLGEALEAHEIRPRDDRTAWQAALDHYEAAGRLLDAPSTVPGLRVLDTVGAVVLARRGSAALRAARAETTFAPAPVCFLDPLHPSPRGRAEVEVAGRPLSVPLCGECRRCLREGREPDVLDVELDGRAVHYLDTDTVWARTGYGALLPDLLHELRTRPGG